MTTRLASRALGLALALTTLAGCGAGPAAHGGGARTPDELEREPAPPREATTEEKSAANHRTGRVAGYVALAVGAQATIVALVTSGMMLHEDGLRSDACDAQKRCSQAGIDANENLSQLAGWNAGAWALGAVGLGVGTVLLVLNPASEKASARPAKGLSLGAPPGGGAGLGLGGSF